MFLKNRWFYSLMAIAICIPLLIVLGDSYGFWGSPQKLRSQPSSLGVPRTLSFETVQSWCRPSEKADCRLEGQFFELVENEFSTNPYYNPGGVRFRSLVFDQPNVACQTFEIPPGINYAGRFHNGLSVTGKPKETTTVLGLCYAQFRDETGEQYWLTTRK